MVCSTTHLSLSLSLLYGCLVAEKIRETMNLIAHMNKKKKKKEKNIWRGQGMRWGWKKEDKEESDQCDVKGCFEARHSLVLTP